ncbi:MAG: aminotransferase class V-fold PLP-dependent enzyme, partial [Ktedonobacterales bacterium]|nr:aminotransferase class V-fold PLP-dependent enzyme [Ktedonobacterales bacterium]
MAEETAAASKSARPRGGAKHGRTAPKRGQTATKAATSPVMPPLEKTAKTAKSPASSPPLLPSQGPEAAGEGPHADLLGWRDEFPILAKKTYLNSCSLGPLSRRSMAAMARFQDLWNEHGAQAWYTIWMGELAALREKFARLIGASVTEVAIAPSVSVALGEIASGLDLGTRNHVVLADMDFPTLAYQWLAKQRIGTDVTFAVSPDRITLPVERFAERIHDRTGLVATSRVFFTSGYIQDVKALADVAHQHGAYLLVDDYQATGQIPLDVKAADMDFLVTGTLKWLMGGPGVAFIYVREELLPRLLPTVTGWWAARDQFQMRTREFEFRDDAQRLEAGTPPMAAIYAASAALDIVHEVGVERIRERTRFLADDLVRRCQARGWAIHSPLDGRQRSSIIMLALEQPDALVKG